MAKNYSISLGDHFAGFIDAQVRSGRFGSASDVMRAALCLLKEHEAQVKSLRDALIVGELSGEPQPLDFDEFKARNRAELGQAAK